MGGLLFKCNCRSNSGTPDVNESYGEDSVVSLPHQKDEANERIAELQSQEQMRKKSHEKDFYGITIAETLNSFRFQQMWTDFTVSVDGNHFPVHKNVLAASCKFFKDFFSTSEGASDYEITNVKPFALEDVLNFLYTAKCTLHQVNVVSVLRVARLFGLQDLQEASEKYLLRLEKRYLKPYMQFVSREDSILPAIQEFQGRGLFCDVTLTTSGGRIIPVHRNILAGVSGYFQGLFRSEMKDVHEGNVDFRTVDDSVVNELLCFIYSGEISITLDNAKSLFQACDYLLIESFKKKFDKFMKSALTVSKFWQIFSLAKCCNRLSEMTNEISRIVASHFWEITSSEEFLGIPEAELKDFLSNDDITISEAQLLESLIRWYKFSKKQREEPFKNLLQLIHMSSIPDLYLKFLAEKEDVNELASYSGHQLRAKVPLDDIKRTARFYNLALFGISSDHHYPCGFVCYWLPFAGPWSFIASTQHPACFGCNSQVVYADGALYLHSYSHDQVRLCFVKNALSFKCFDPMASSGFLQWTEDVPTAVTDSVIIAFSCYIYFLGGETPTENIAAVQRYDTNSQSWERLSSMQERRSRHFAVNYEDRYIYVFGGVDSSSVEKYDPEEDCWSYVAPMHQSRCDGQACVLTDKILVIGGNLPCEIYDSCTNEWQIGSFEIKRISTLKPLNELKDVGTLCQEMLCNDETNRDGEGDNNSSSEVDPLGLELCLPHDGKCYDHHYVYRASLTYYNGAMIVFDLDAFQKRNLRTLKLPVYFVNPETGNFRTLYSLPSWPNSVSRGILVPLRRKEMATALKDYPGNKT